MFKVGPLFAVIWALVVKIIINQGGTASGKTYTTLQVLFLKAIKEHGVVITVVGQDIPNLKKGAFRDAQNIYNTMPEVAAHIKNFNKSDRYFEFTNGSIIEFNSYDDEQDAKNGKRHYLFVNEANGIPYMVYWQLAIRTSKQIFIDYNPTAKFWVHDKLIGEPDTELIISDHRHNPFLSDEDHYKIEHIKDDDLWKVYARGITGNLVGTIYPDWICIPVADFPSGDDFFGGLDFGYTNDPTVLMKIARIGDSIFLHECCYETGIAPQKLHEIATANGFDGNQPIYTEHDPDTIVPLKRLRMNIHPARKGPGSIKAGISRMKEFKVFYTASSKNTAEELKRYLWQMDGEGKPTNMPIDKWNHAMDASRYGVYTRFFRRE